MARTARRTIGRAGATVPPGRAARGGALLLAGIAAALAVLAGALWYQEADLRALDGLDRATATVLVYDDGRRRNDVTVEFATDRGTREVTIPYGGSAREGDDVEVAFTSVDPDRARTVDDWDPAYGYWAAQALVFGVLALLVGAFGLVSGRLRGRWESDRPVGDAPLEALGRRIVRGTLTVQVIITGFGVATAVTLCWLAVVDPGARPQLLAGAAAGFAFFAALAGLQHWLYARDGVWATDEELVARRRSRVRRWPWAQVLELGVTVEKDTATAAAARVDDGTEDGIGEDGWVTLARPSAGRLGAHAWAVRFQALADERGLPFTEGLMSSDLADSLTTTYVRRRPRPASRAPDTREQPTGAGGDQVDTNHTAS